MAARPLHDLFRLFRNCLRKRESAAILLAAATTAMKKTIAFLASVILCSACSSPPLAPSDVRRDHQTTTTICSPLSSDVALARLKQAWERCYVGPGLSNVTIGVGGVPMTVPVAGGGASMRVEVENSDKVRTLVLRTPSGNILLIADIGATENCSAQVTARGWNFGWDRAAANTQAWLDDPNAPGPAMSCR